MASAVSIDIMAQDRGATRTLNRATQSLSVLDQTARATGGGVNALAAEAQRAQVGVTNLGRGIFSTSAEAKKFNGVFRDQTGRLREANGLYTKTSERVKRLGNNLAATGRSAQGLGNNLGLAGRGAGNFTRVLGTLGSVLGALGIAAVGQQVAQFGITSVQAAGRLEQYVRATEQITGSSEAAAERIDSLIEIANLPGLNFEALTRYSNRLIAAGVAAADTDKILLTVGQTIVSLGGTAANAELAMEQLIQAFQLGKVDFRDFRTIVQQIPGFLEALGDVHGVASNLDGLHEAFEKTGNSIRDLVIPVFDELARRFDSPPSDSYIVVMDELANAFFLAQAAIGDKFLPTVIGAAQGLTDFFEAIRTGLTDVTTLPEPIQEIVRGAQALYEGLTNVVDALTTNAGPALTALYDGLGPLLVSVLELAGAIGTALSPAFRVWGDIIAVVFAAIGQLAEHISILIGGITDAINWVNGLWREEDKLKDSTDATTKSVEQLVDETNKAVAARQQLTAASAAAAKVEEASNQTTKDQVQELTQLQAALDQVSERLAQKTARYEELLQRGAKPAAASMQQLERQITTLEGSASTLSAQVDTLKNSLVSVEAPIEVTETAMRAAVDSVDAFGGALGEIDTKLLGFRERADTLSGAIRRLPPDLTAVRDEFDVLAPTAARVDAIFTSYNETLGRFTTKDFIVSLVDARAETQAFNQIFRELQTQITSFAADQAIATAEFRLVNPVISEAVGSFRNYIETLDSASISTENIEKITDGATGRIQEYTQAVLTAEGVIGNFGSRIDEATGEYIALEKISRDVTASARDQASAFDKLRTEIDHTKIAGFDASTSLDRLDTTMQDIDYTTTDLFMSLTEMGYTTEQALEVVRKIYGDVSTDASNLTDRIIRENDALLNSYENLADGIIEAFTRVYDNAFARLPESGAADFGSAIFDPFVTAISSGNPGALIDIPFNIHDAFQAQDQRREARRAANAERDFLGDTNLDRIADALNLPGGFADFDFTRGNPIINEDAIAGHQLPDDFIAIQIASLVNDLDRAIEGVDIQRIFDPFIEGFETAMERAGQGFADAIERGRGTAVVEENFQEYLGSINNFFDAQIEAVRAEERATGVLLTEVVTSIEGSRSNVLNAARLATEASQPNLQAQSRAAFRANEARQNAPGPSALSQQYAAAVEEGQAVDGTDIIELTQEQIERLQTRTATRLANDAIAAISEAAADVNRTEETILTLWQAAVPSIEDWYNELREDIVNNPNLSDTEQTEALAELGTIEAFVDNLKSQYVTPVIQGIRQSTEALQTRTANRLANKAIGSIGEAASDVNATEQTIVDLWTAAIPSIENWWNELYQDILNDPNLSNAEQTEALAELGTQQDFVDSLKSQYVTPAVQGIRQGIEALQTKTATRVANEAIDAIGEAAADVNITEATILELWQAAVPSLESWYSELHDDIINDPNLSSDEQAEALAELGTVEDFVSRLKSQQVDPLIRGIRQSAEVLQTRTASRAANDAIRAIGEAAADVNVTEATLLSLWQSTIPSIENWYNELRDDIVNNPNLSDAEQTEALAELGTVEDFVANLKSQHVTPIVEGIRRNIEALETRTASRVANDAIAAIGEAAGDVNTTEQTILSLWESTVPLIENWYSELRDDIVNDPNLSNAEQAEALVELGTIEAFVANIKAQHVTPVIQGIHQGIEALQTKTASRVANAAIGAIGEAAGDVNITEETILSLWAEAIPSLENWYAELRDDIENDPNLSDTEKSEALAGLGSVEDFVNTLKTQHVTPIVENIRQGIEALQTRTANRLANDAIASIAEAAGDVNVTEQSILSLWESAIPSIENWYLELRDDIENDPNLSETQQAEALAELQRR